MSCFFSCFRVKHASSSSTGKQSSPEETTVNRNRSPLSSFLVPEENASGSRKGNGLVEQDLDFEELRNQAKFLKACGTPPKTPEIGKVATRKKNVLSSQNGTAQSPKSRSWLTYTSGERLDLESRQGQLTGFNKDSEEWLDGTGSQEQTSSSCMTFEHNMEGISLDFSEGKMAQNAGSGEVLSVSSYNSLESSVSSNITDVTGSAGTLNNAKRCPYLTPLKHTDEIQTLGTVFQGNVNGIGKGESPRMRTPYVPPSAVNPLVGSCESKVLDDGGQDPNKESDKSEEPKKIETSVYSRSTTVAENLHGVKNPGERPIIGLVATHWSDSDHSRVSPKWWDGNGIPNSTNKYREDQKVSWIATSFEERLEKALSEEYLISQRRQSSGTPPLGSSLEAEESDTAMSKLQGTTSHFNPVFSF